MTLSLFFLKYLSDVYAKFSRKRTILIILFWNISCAEPLKKSGVGYIQVFGFQWGGVWDIFSVIIEIWIFGGGGGAL